MKCICFGSEEIGLEGSKAFMRAHEGDKEKLLCMINLDVGGNLLGNTGVVVTATPGAEEYVKGILKEGGIFAKVRSSVMSSDSAVFSDYGVPSISFGSMTPRNGGYMHTRYDNMDMISADVLGEEVETLIYVAGRLSSAESFPIQKEISKEMQEQIIKYFGAGLSQTEKRRNEKK